MPRERAQRHPRRPALPDPPPRPPRETRPARGPPRRPSAPCAGGRPGGGGRPPHARDSVKGGGWGGRGAEPPAGAADRARPRTRRRPPHACGRPRHRARNRARAGPAVGPWRGVSCRNLLPEPAAEPGMRPGQLGLGEAHRLTHHGRNFLVRVTLDIVQPDYRAGGFSQPLEGGFEVHPERHILPAHRGDLVVQLVGVAVLVAPEPHQRLAGGDGPDPAPETSVPPEAADAPAYFVEGFLHHVLGV